MKKTLDWKEYENTARQAIAEGCVLLENNGVLPLKKDCTVSVFGRIQNSYFKSGTGSGGKVNVTKVWNIVEGLEESGHVKINETLRKVYSEWEKTHPIDEGMGWGKEPWAQEEMPLTQDIVKTAAEASDVALVIIGRTAGEDKDNSATKGSWFLTDKEYDMLRQVREGFEKMAVVLNVGNIIDMGFVADIKPDAVLYGWQGGMIGGLGTADVLTGKVNPCGKLPDTIAKSITDYPSDKWFGKPEGNFYCEDIFVGYRYFETFAKDKVLYPFGYGLSYTSFKLQAVNAENDNAGKKINLKIKITNAGSEEGKEVVQVYVSAPNGKLGKAARVLVDFEKTEALQPSASQELDFEIPYYNFASYDDGEYTGNKSSFVLEEGNYKVYAGTDVRSACEVLNFDLDSLLVIKECEEAYAPVRAFERMHATAEGTLTMEPAPLSTIDMWQRRKERLPQEIPQTGDKGYKLQDVLNKKIDINTFVAQFSDEDLACLVRGEGMGSSLVTPGTASAFGGVSPRLRDTFGIPVACCDDGPSGMRLDCGMKAFSLPNGTSLACTFNKALVKKLYTLTGLEMTANHVENLLGPGMNIHRHPLNGRNFEYFSEDPFLTGAMGTAIKRKTDVVFCANMFNELFWDTPQPLEQVSKKYAGELLPYLKEKASVFVAEPGVPRAARFVSLLRDSLMRKGFMPLSPCPHVGVCPMDGRKGGKWCHFTLLTDEADAPEKLLKLSASAGIPKDRASLSFVFVSSAVGGAAAVAGTEKPVESGSRGTEKSATQTRSADALKVRVVSDSIKLGDRSTGRYACSEAGLTLVVAPEKAFSSGDMLETAISLEKAKKLPRDKKSGALKIEL